MPRFDAAAVIQLRKRQHYPGLEKPLLVIVEGMDSDGVPTPRLKRVFAETVDLD